MAADASVATGVAAFWAIYGSVITGGAVIISAIGAILVIRSNRGIARRRATLDLILHIESDGDLLSARNAMVALKKQKLLPSQTSKWGTAEERDSPQAEAIRTTLNINELVAISIDEGVIDERIYRRWFNKAFIDDHNMMTGYINSVREFTESPAAFKELERLATRWKDDHHFYDQPGWFTRKAHALRCVWRA